MGVGGAGCGRGVGQRGRCDQHCRHEQGTHENLRFHDDSLIACRNPSRRVALILGVAGRASLSQSTESARPTPLDLYVYAYKLTVMAIELPCYCASIRRAARVISQVYEEALRDTPLTITQFTLLTLLDRVGVARVNDIAAALAMDQTTLSRTLALMQRDGLIAPAEGEDLRETRWQLTATGRRRMRSVLPRWRAAQKRVEKLVGKDEAARLKKVAQRLTTRLAS